MAEQTEKQKAATARMRAANQAKRDAAAAEDRAPEPVNLKTPPSMAKPLGLIVGQVNNVLLAFPLTRDDALSQAEAEMLVQGLDDGQKASPKLRKYLRSGTEGAGLLSLGMALFAIAFERLARHGWIPGIPARPLTAEERDARDQAIYQQMLDAAQQQAEAQAWQAQQESGAVPPEWNPSGPAMVPPVYSNAGAV